MKTIKTLAICAAALLATEASAMSGNELKDNADAYVRVSQGAHYLPDVSNAGIFSGYVQAIAKSSVSFTFCLSKDVTNGQIYAIVVKYLNDNPEKWNIHPANLIQDAMTQAFPCAEE